MAIAFTRTTRSLTNDTSNYALLAWFFGSVLLSAWVAWFFFAEITVYEFSANARLEINRSANPITTPVAGKIIALSASIGQNVKTGDVLVELDASSEKQRLKEEQARLQALPAQIANLNNEINTQQQSKSIDREGGSAATQSARSRYQEALAVVGFANDNYRRLEIDAQTRASQKQTLIENLKREIARLTGELATTQATIARLQLDIDNHLIKSPVDGKIGDMPSTQVGSYVAAGEKLGAVVPQSELRIVADFNPASVLGRVHEGQRSQMRLDGLPWTQYGSIDAKVSKVSTEIRDNLVRVELVPELADSSAINFQHGLPGAVEVNIEQTSPAALVLRAVGQILASPKPQQTSAAL